MIAPPFDAVVAELDVVTAMPVACTSASVAPNVLWSSSLRSVGTRLCKTRDAALLRDAYAQDPGALRVAYWCVPTV